MTQSTSEHESANTIRRSTSAIGVLLITLGWAAGGTIGRYISEGDLSTIVLYPIGWVVGGLVTTIVLYWACTYVHWQQSLVMTMGWLMSWPFSMAIGGGIGAYAGAVVMLTSGESDVAAHAITIGMTIGMVIAGTIAGFGIGLALRWANPSVRRGQLFMIDLGWFIAWAIGGSVSTFIEGNLVSPIGWAISGALGSSVMFWQLVKVGTAGPTATTLPND
jgi:hypothetical protein